MPENQAPLEGLTPAERRAWPLLIDAALSRKEIASAMHLSESAVRDLAQRIYAKSGLHGPSARRQLIARYGAPIDRLEDLERRVAALEVKVV